MRLSSLLTALIGLGVAGGSAFVARDMIEKRSAVAVQNDESAMVSVIVAANDIAFGQAIEARMLRTIDWPRDAVPLGVFTSYDLLLPEEGQPSRRARRAISKDELIQVNKVSDYGEKVTIVQSIGTNQRAMAIKVSAETAVGGFVTPGDFVDVLLTQGRDETLRAVTILQNIRVIGVDQDADEQTDAPEVARTVTVEVTPDQGQRLALAQQAGTLSLTLRTLDYTEDKPLDSIRLSDLLQDVSPLPEDAPSRTIAVRRANVLTLHEVN
ncbi:MULTISPECIES: Flp pilus assembly protein CpaB [Halocynthiibacter]|uniref:Flp pilus assembly protein CpaB n=1 Tax=Halocynthiibacter halioticoli TaxID=2986804 RepID=A0AAE3LT37_9RHOB|nr:MULTISPECIES: Flp pilus assembly protein CpaB [Halocynthiibacter]MCV6824441.1 Flp pilus assembly protein CpaB [Halocynthiibacter halioticoli]MCW4057442.1 Flp pilus assembly protein CpaB [Halocynthiibacter sp. SDUM655004]MDE0589521.1 Flp pilus assembly protein CpaB [Halocynthiibacter sp. C4]